MFKVEDAQRFADIAQEEVYDSRDRHDKEWQELRVARMGVKRPNAWRKVNTRKSPPPSRALSTHVSGVRGR